MSKANFIKLSIEHSVLGSGSVLAHLAEQKLFLPWGVVCIRVEQRAAPSRGGDDHVRG